MSSTELTTGLVHQEAAIVFGLLPSRERQSDDEGPQVVGCFELGY